MLPQGEDNSLGKRWDQGEDVAQGKDVTPE